MTIEAEIITDETKTKEIIQEDVFKSINSYLLNLKKTWEESASLVVRKAQIETIILNTNGVIDISNTRINEQSSNILLEENEIPKLKEVLI